MATRSGHASPAVPIPRTRLSAVLLDPGVPAPISVRAPAGYGKTTLLREWAELEPRAVARLGPVSDGTDLGRLVDLARQALAGAGLPGFADAVAPGRAAGDALAETAEAIAGLSTPFVLVVDDVHRLTDARARCGLQVLGRSVPPGSQLVVSGRPGRPGPPTGGRDDGTEIGSDDLALDRGEARAVLAAHGVTVDDDVLAHVMERTEGWPALVGLAARSAQDAQHRGSPTALDALRGNERSFAPFLDDEVLAELDPIALRFLEQTSVVERLTGPLCDAAIGAEHSATLLEALVMAGWSFVVPLDDERRAYRLHPLVADELRHRFEHSDPDGRADVCRRASRWCEQHDRRDEAIDLAARAGDAERVGDLLLPVLLERLAAGHGARIRAALGVLGPTAVETTPALALVRCWLSLGRGDVDGAHRWLATTFAGLAAAPAGGAPATLAAARCTRALAGAGGVDQVLRDAQRVLPSGPGPHHWWVLATTLQGHAHLMMGDLVAAGRVLRDAEQVAGANPLLHAAALGNLALLATVEQDWDDARACAAQAEDELAHHGIAGNEFTILIHAVSALTLAHAGRTREALPRIGSAVHLIESLAWAAPRHRIAAAALCAEALLVVGDADRAAALYTVAEGLLPREPKALLLHDLCRALHERLAPVDAAPVASVGLTPAELRVLQHLPTHRSLREISEQLYVSPHTIKSQTIAVYRKLGVRSRSQAVEAARELHLIAD